MTEANHAANRQKFQRFWEGTIADFRNSITLYARTLVRRIQVAEAEDIVAAWEVRLLWYSKDPSTIGDLKFYVRRALHNVWADEVRKSGVGVVKSINDPTTAKEIENLFPPVAPEVLANQEGDEIRQEFEKLGPLTDKEKELVVLVTQHYTLEDIADFWGEDVYRTKTRWQRLIAKQRYRINTRNKRKAAKQAGDEGPSSGDGPIH